jgi:hypothetical protein
LLGEVAADHEVGEGAEGDEILGEQVPRGGEIDRAHMLGQFAKPGFDGGEIFRGGLRVGHSGGSRSQALHTDGIGCSLAS